MKTPSWGLISGLLLFPVDAVAQGVVTKTISIDTGSCAPTATTGGPASNGGAGQAPRRLQAGLAVAVARGRLPRLASRLEVMESAHPEFRAGLEAMELALVLRAIYRKQLSQRTGNWKLTIVLYQIRCQVISG